MISRKISLLTNTVCSSFVTRAYRHVKARPVQKSKNTEIKGNPGGNRLLNMVLDGEDPDVSKITLEDIDDGENDLLNSHLFYDEHVKELKKQKQFKSFQNIKRKYFKINSTLPNFLTYFEKQQIKHLHNNSPQEWTPETLSSCFPATSDIIIKILKSNWTADEGEQILRHDKLVQTNWERFRNGLFNEFLPDELKNHLAKFSERRPTLITLEQAEAYIPKPASSNLKPGEFGQIITSYLGEPENQNEQTLIEAKENPEIERIYENDTSTRVNKKHYTLDELKNNSHEESFSFHSSQILSKNETNIDAKSIEASLKESTNVMSRKEVSEYIDSVNDYPLAIRIPKKVWKEGYTYRVKDCFYDDKGDFLYRVPGLITNEDKQNQ